MILRGQWPLGLHQGDLVAVVRVDPHNGAGHWAREGLAGGVFPLHTYWDQLGDPYPWGVQGRNGVVWVHEVRHATPEERAAHWLDRGTVGA